MLSEGFVEVFKYPFKNQGTDTLATQAPLKGDLNEVEAGVWPTILNIFKNAWIQVFTTDVDEAIEFEDALPGIEELNLFFHKKTLKKTIFAAISPYPARCGRE